MLAILAFVMQIVVFVAQAWTSSQQVLQSESLHSETKALLTEVTNAGYRHYKPMPINRSTRC